MAARALGLMLLAGFLLPGGAEATARIARRSGLNCTMCHVDARGRLGLTAVGEQHRRAGLRASLDPELTVPGELRPLSPGGARMLHRRVHELGRRLFQMRDLGRSRKACASCHADGQGLSPDLVTRYPRWRPDLERWTTLEGAIQDCLDRRVGSERLQPGTRSAIALQLYVREVAGQPARPYLDDPAWGMSTKAPRTRPMAESTPPDAPPPAEDSDMLEPTEGEPDDGLLAPEDGLLPPEDPPGMDLGPDDLDEELGEDAPEERGEPSAPGEADELDDLGMDDLGDL